MAPDNLGQPDLYAKSTDQTPSIDRSQGLIVKEGIPFSLFGEDDPRGRLYEEGLLKVGRPIMFSSLERFPKGERSTVIDLDLLTPERLEEVLIFANEGVKGQFDQLKELYNESNLVDPEKAMLLESVIQIAVRYLVGREDLTVIDGACGSLNYGPDIVNALLARTFYGFDPGQSMIQQARKNMLAIQKENGVNVELWNGTLQNMNFPENTLDQLKEGVDLITIFFGLHFVPQFELPKVFAQFAKIQQRGDLVISTTLNRGFSENLGGFPKMPNSENILWTFAGIMPGPNDTYIENYLNLFPQSAALLTEIANKEGYNHHRINARPTKEYMIKVRNLWRYHMAKARESGLRNVDKNDKIGLQFASMRLLAYPLFGTPYSIDVFRRR